MFKALLMALAIGLTTSLFAASKAATEAWVEQYVSNQLSAVTQKRENGVTTLSITENGSRITATIEDPTVMALVLDECAEILKLSGVTNGITFAYVDNGLYRAGANNIQATSTNLVLNGRYNSREFDGRCYFVDGYTQIAKVYWTMIQPCEAAEL